MSPAITRRHFLHACTVTGAGLAVGTPRGFSRGRSIPQDIRVGLDIGSSKVCAAVAERLPDGTIQLLGIGEAPSYASKLGIADPEGVRRSVRAALVSAEVNTDVMIGGVMLGLKAGPQGRLRSEWAMIDFLEGHEDSPLFAERFLEIWEDIPRMIDFAREQEDALLLDLHGEYLCAYEPSTPFWNDEPLVEVKRAVSASLAGAEAVLSPEDKERGALVIDLGAGTTDFTVWADGFAHSDCIQVGGRYLAIDVPPGMVSRLRQVEALSMESRPLPDGNSFSARDGPVQRFDCLGVMHTFELIKARLEVRGIDLASLRAGVHLIGGHSVLPRVREFAECMLGIPVQPGRVKGIAGPPSLLADARYACALGLAKCGHVQS